MPSVCNVSYCRKNSKYNKENAYFTIPKDPFLREQWLSFAQIKGKIPIQIRICSDHFEEKYFLKKFPRFLLVRNAVPTIGKGYKRKQSQNDSTKSDEDENCSSIENIECIEINSKNFEIECNEDENCKPIENIECIEINEKYGFWTDSSGVVYSS